MNAFFSAAADAALPVAVALLVLGAIARGVLWAQLDDPRGRRLARQYLGPLSTWSVAGFIVYALTLVAAGEAATAPLAIALVSPSPRRCCAWRAKRSRKWRRRARRRGATSSRRTGAARRPWRRAASSRGVGAARP